MSNKSRNSETKTVAAIQFTKSTLTNSTFKQAAIIQFGSQRDWAIHSPCNAD